jgi:hypothetical protein
MRAAKAKCREKFAKPNQATPTPPPPPIIEAPKTSEPSRAPKIPKAMAGATGEVDYGEPPFLPGPQRATAEGKRRKASHHAAQPDPNKGSGPSPCPAPNQPRRATAPEDTWRKVRPGPCGGITRGRVGPTTAEPTPPLDHLVVAARLKLYSTPPRVEAQTVGRADLVVAAKRPRPSSKPPAAQHAPREGDLVVAARLNRNHPHRRSRETSPSIAVPVVADRCQSGWVPVAAMIGAPGWI